MVEVGPCGDAAFSEAVIAHGLFGTYEGAEACPSCGAVPLTDVEVRALLFMLPCVVLTAP